MNTYFLVAAILSAFNSCLHLFAGGKSIARPLLDATGLSDEVKYVQYYCWHIATLSLILQTVLFAFAANDPAHLSLGVAATVFAASFAVLGIGMVPALAISYKTVPQGWLFVPVTVVGALGIFM